MCNAGLNRLNGDSLQWLLFYVPALWAALTSLSSLFLFSTRSLVSPFSTLLPLSRLSSLSSLFLALCQRNSLFSYFLSSQPLPILYFALYFSSLPVFSPLQCVSCLWPASASNLLASESKMSLCSQSIGLSLSFSFSLSPLSGRWWRMRRWIDRGQREKEKEIEQKCRWVHFSFCLSQHPMQGLPEWPM